jgi:pimeloyl-ACP methyl ester carboxylesterase
VASVGARSAVDVGEIRISVLCWEPPGSVATKGDAVLLHGLQSSAGTQVAFARALVERGWRVHALDLPGHGHSEWLTRDGTPDGDPEAVDPERYGLEAVAGVVGEALRTLDLATPTLLAGHSWGAGVAAATLLAGVRPGVALLIDPPFLPPDAAIALGEDLRAGLTDDRAAAIERLRSNGEPWDPDELEAKAEALSRASPLAQRAVAASGAFAPEELARRWAEVNATGVPVHVVVGEPERGSMVPHAARTFLSSGRGATVHVIDGAGHTPQRTHSERFLEVLDDLLSEVV